MRTIFCFLLMLFLICPGGLSGQIVLPRLISDGAVLQRDMPLNLWGKASRGEHVDLIFKNLTYTTNADDHGRWQITLPKQEAGGPYNMIFRASNEITVHNVLFGDVWICSGQSNMELMMDRVRDKYPDIIHTVHNTSIRQFTVPDAYDFHSPHDDMNGGQWVEATTDHILEFSAVAFFFATNLNRDLQIPIGLINSALGGSPVEAWMSEEALKAFPYAYEELMKFRDDDYVHQLETSDQARARTWYQQINAKDEGRRPGREWFRPDTKEDDWDQMHVPGYWADDMPGTVNGVAWFRKHINLPEHFTNKEVTLWLGRIVDCDSVFVNGIFVGTVSYQYPPRKYTIPAGILHQGENVIAVRVINEQGKGGFVNDKPYFLAVPGDTISLTGIWKYKIGATAQPLASPTFVRWMAGGLYNVMIAPLLRYGIKGAIWYQGEANTKNPKEYASVFPAMIADWRNHWKHGDFPFLYVQLANFMEERDHPVESSWAELRQSQLTSLTVPNTGMAVSIDLGEWNDIHPLNKYDVGKRLALLAYTVAYDQPKWSAKSPTPKRVKFSNDYVEVFFRDAAGGLTTRDGGTPVYFELSSDGKQFVNAKAVIKGDNVLISNDGLKNPVAVRYAWADNPAKANLISVIGLPASPFEWRKK